MGGIYDFLTGTKTVYIPEDKFDTTVAQCQIEGWEVLETDDGMALMKWAGTSGSLLNHLIVGVLTAPTLGLGNLAYASHKKQKTSKRIRLIATKK